MASLIDKDVQNLLNVGGGEGKHILAKLRPGSLVYPLLKDPYSGRSTRSFWPLEHVVGHQAYRAVNALLPMRATTNKLPTEVKPFERYDGFTSVDNGYEFLDIDKYETSASVFPKNMFCVSIVPTYGNYNNKSEIIENVLNSDDMNKIKKENNGSIVIPGQIERVTAPIIAFDRHQNISGLYLPNFDITTVTNAPLELTLNLDKQALLLQLEMALYSHSVQRQNNNRDDEVGSDPYFTISIDVFSHAYQTKPTFTLEYMSCYMILETRSIELDAQSNQIMQRTWRFNYREIYFNYFDKTLGR